MSSLLTLHRAHLLGYVSALLAVTTCACTPVSPARAGSQQQQAGASGSSSAAAPGSDTAGSSSDAAGSGKTQSAPHQADQPCTEDAARSCTSGNPSRQPLQCTAGMWREQPACNEGQRCETAAGPDQGGCVRIARECIGRVPEQPFCDQLGMRVCTAAVPSDVRACGAEQHCVEKNDIAACECTAGKVMVAGECQVPQDCGDQNGGCDSLVGCSMNGSSRVCGACAPGYSGDGLVGCTPLLTMLNADASTLIPELSDDVRSYRIHLPMFQTQLALTPVAADGVEINVNGTKLSPGASWTSDKLSAGEHPLAITLNASNGLTSRYEILVEHTGAQEAFIKAKHPDRNDNFGFALALSGDTLVVGAPHEDGAVAGIDGDETSNTAAESGAAYVFVRGSDGWKQQAYLKSDAPLVGDHFGGAVALDGDLLLVSETGDEPFPTASENTAKRPGAVHVFTRDNTGKWSAAAKIASPSTSADLFGYALTMDKGQILIGAPFDSGNAGAFYTLPRDGKWGPLTKYTLRESSADTVFGWAFALDGDNLLVGAPEKTARTQRQGKVAFFTRAGGAWQQQQVLSAPAPEDGATYGWSVALSGDSAAVGAPFADAYDIRPSGHAFVYARAAGTWSVQKSLTATVPRDIDYFGSAIQFAGANTLLIGANGDASGSAGLDADPTQGVSVQSGAFYFFSREGAQSDDWVSTSFIKTDLPGANAWLGQQAAISGDTIAVSCANENSAAIGVNGEATGANTGSGAVYVFR